MKGMLMRGLRLSMRGARVSTQANGAAAAASRGCSWPKANPLAPVSNSDLVRDKNSHLALARDGLVEEQAAAVLLLQARVFGPGRTGSSAGTAGPSEGLEVVGGQRRRRRGRVGLVAGGGPAPVASGRAVAGRSERSGGTVVFPRPAQNLWGTEVSPKRGEDKRQRQKKDKESKLEMEAT